MIKYTNSFFTWKNLMSIPKAKLKRIRDSFYKNWKLYYLTPMRWLYRTEVVLGNEPPQEESHIKYVPKEVREKRERIMRAYLKDVAKRKKTTNK